MGDDNSDDWLPEGWRVEVKVRASGKKYKVYFPPSDGLKLYSKPAVCRYLSKIGHNKSEESDKNPELHKESGEKNEEPSEIPNESKEKSGDSSEKNRNESDEKDKDPSKICDESEEKDIDIDKYPSKHQNESAEMNKTPRKQSRNVVFEEVDTEGLPPGWRKEVKLTKKRGKTRKDSFYYDPVTGYIFYSMKDVLRYLKTGIVGRLATKPKHNTDVKTDNDKNGSPSEAKKQKLDVDGTSAKSTNSQSSELIKDEPILTDTASVGECKSSPDQCGVRAESGNSNLAEVAGSSKHVDEEDTKMEENVSAMNSEGGLSYESKGLNLADAVGAADLEVAKDLNISAVSVDTLPDKKSPESDVVIKNERKRSNTKKMKDLSTPRRASKRLAGVQLDPTPELETIHQNRRDAVKEPAEPDLKSSVESYENTEDFSISKAEISDEKLPVGNNSTRECEGNGEIIDKINEILKPLPQVPLPDLWTDPCIAFAIKTLTEPSFDNSDTTELSPMAKSCGSLSEGTSIVENISKINEARQTNDKNEASPVKNLSSHGKGIENNENAGDKPGCGANMPSMDMWKDPCIEFAIKTLTGTIPVGLNTDNRDHYQQQPTNVAQAQVISTGSNLPDLGFGYFRQNEYLRQQFDSAPKQQTSPQPGFNPSQTAGLQNSGATNGEQWKWRYRG